MYNSYLLHRSKRVGCWENKGANNYCLKDSANLNCLMNNSLKPVPTGIRALYVDCYKS